MSLPRVHSGARAILTLNNKVLVYAMQVSYDITTNIEEIHAIDNPLPEELAPTQIKVRVTCGVLRVPRESASVLALQPTILNSLHQPYTTIEIRDRQTDDVILRVGRAMMTRRTGQIATRQLAQETWTFVGIGYRDERAPQEAVGLKNENAIDSPFRLPDINRSPV